MVVEEVAEAVFRQDAPFDVNEGGGARENVQHHDSLPFHETFLDGGWFYFCDNPPKSCLHER